MRFSVLVCRSASCRLALAAVVVALVAASCTVAKPGTKDGAALSAAAPTGLSQASATPDAHDLGDPIANRGQQAEESVRDQLPEDWVDVTGEGTIGEPMATPESSTTQEPTAADDITMPDPNPATPYISQLVAPAGSSVLIDFDTADLSTPENAIEEFFAAFQAGDYPLVYRLLGPHGQGELGSSAVDESGERRAGLATEPAWASIKERTANLPGVANHYGKNFVRAMIVLEEAAAHGALPVDMSAGITGLQLAPSDDGPLKAYPRFTATLNATGELVEIHAIQNPVGDWRVHRVAIPGFHLWSLPFAGPTDATSQILDPTSQWSSYDMLSDDTPEEALEQFGEFAANKDWFRLYMMFDLVAQQHAAIAAGDNTRRFLTDEGFAQFRPIQYDRPAAESTAAPFRVGQLLDWATSNDVLAAPLEGYVITGRTDSTDERGNAIVTFEAEHPSAPGVWTITMAQESLGWRLRQIRSAAGSTGRFPISTDSTIEVWTGSEVSIVEVKDLRTYVQATVAYADPAEFDRLWAGFLEATDHPAYASFGRAYVEAFSGLESHVFWVDWKASDQVEWQASYLAEAVGLDDSFTWDWEPAVADYQSGEDDTWPVTAGMQTFDLWLGERGYHLVGLDFGWDAYIAVVVPNEAAFVQAAQSAGMATYLVSES